MAVVKLVTVFSNAALFEIRADLEPITALLESKTETLIPSIPSAELSAAAETVNVTVEEPEAIVTEPDNESVSAEPALFTVAPLVSPATLYVNDVSEDTAALAVIVYVIVPPSATLLTSAERAYEDAEEVTELPDTVPDEPSEIVEPVGNEGTPIADASCAYVLEDPVMPEVILPPTSYVNLSAPLIVITAPLDNVN